MEADGIAIAVRLLAFMLVFGLGLWALVAALLIGPGRNLTGSTLGFLDNQAELEEAAGRTVRRPLRRHLKSTDPEVRRRALQSYRDRSKNALRTFDSVRPKAIRQSIYVVAGTLVGSTLAFAAFVAANDFFFGQGPALIAQEHQSYWVALLVLIVSQFDAALQLNILSAFNSQHTFASTGLGTAWISPIYRLVLAWSVPVVIQQVRWIVWDLQPRIEALKADLQRIVDMTDDDKLLEHLRPYVERRASWSGWIATLWDRQLNQLANFSGLQIASQPSRQT